LPQDWKAVQRRWLENISSQEERGQDRTSPFLIRNAIEVMHDFVDDNANLIHMAERLHNVSAILETVTYRAPSNESTDPQRIGRSSNSCWIPRGVISACRVQDWSASGPPSPGTSPAHGSR
jgi:hypothetical protein